MTSTPTPKLPTRRPYEAHDRELDEANRQGIRPPERHEQGR